jgi:hypothetical protein
LRPLIVEAAGRSADVPAAAQAAENDTPAPVRRAPAVERSRAAHLVFVPTEAGYTLVERAGDVPPVLGHVDGSELGMHGGFWVSKVGSSPLPGDERRCAYLERE